MEISQKTAVSGDIEAVLLCKDISAYLISRKRQLTEWLTATKAETVLSQGDPGDLLFLPYRQTAKRKRPLYMLSVAVSWK